MVIKVRIVVMCERGIKGVYKNPLRCTLNIYTLLSFTSMKRKKTTFKKFSNWRDIETC